MDGFVEENDLKEIEGCYNGGKPLEADIAAALEDAKNKDIAGAIAKLQAVAAAFPAELATCKSITTDVAAVAAWAKTINKQKVLANLFMHKAKVEADVKEIEDDFTAGKFFDSGKAAADALMLVAGPVKPKHRVEATLPQPKDVGLFIAGLLDEFVEGNKLTEIEACYNGAKPLEADLAEALKDAENKDFPGAIAKIQAVAAAAPGELTTCKAIGDDLSAFEAWAKALSPEKIAEMALLHKAKIEADVKQIEADWTAGNFFTAGKEAADALAIVLGPVHPSAFLQ